MASKNVVLLCATALVTLAGPAFAADMPQPVPQYVGGWYLRGDIGWSSQAIGSLTNPLDSTADTLTTVSKNFSSAGIFGGGIGYQFNDWFRTDLTGEYRGPSTFHGLQIYSTGGEEGTDEYTATKSEWLFLANAYVDLGNWRGIVPFVGGGIGASRNTISGFTDVNTPNLGVAYGGTASTWQFAWALTAGLGYQISPNTTIEVAYRYLDLGKAMSGDLVTYDGSGPNTNNPSSFNHLTSQDVKFSIRYKFN
ncbi:MAG: porin family protein [Rhizobiales bacterium]|nr:porin family protein [Hyphomicrobiales bacterium]